MRLLFPRSNFTLDDAVDYYKRVAKWMLPHLRARPVSFKRYPGTIDDESYWEKDAPSFTPEWVKTFAVPRRSDDSDIHYIVVDNTKTLLWIARSGGIEIHPFLHRIPRIDIATSVVFDLDPGQGATFRQCCRVALILRDALEKLSLQSFAKVSGSKGLQIYVPLNGEATHEQTETFARLLADELARRNPKLIVSKMAKHLRARKVFIDWSQNASYKTTVGVYSLRTKRDEPFVSMPVTWEEVAAGKRLDFRPNEAIDRLLTAGDLFKPALTLKQRLPFSAAKSVKPPARRGKHRTQSGRRTYLLVRTEQAGDELWLQDGKMLERWILRPDRDKRKRLIAVPAGRFGFDPKNYHGATVREEGTYEVITESVTKLELFFTGKTLKGRWRLELIEAGHRSWSLSPD